MNLIRRMRLHMEMGSRGLLPGDKHFFNQRWGDLWDLPIKDKKLCLRDVTEERTCEKWTRDREKSEGKISRQPQKVHGSPNTG